MSEMVLYLQAHLQQMTAGLLVLLLIGIAIGEIRLLYRLKKMQRDIDGITGKVQKYLSVVLEAEENAPAEDKPQVVPKKAHSEEEDSRLISAVLQEIFP